MDPFCRALAGLNLFPYTLWPSQETAARVSTVGEELAKVETVEFPTHSIQTALLSIIQASVGAHR